MRDRLIELIVDAENEICMEKPYFSDTERIERVADHLFSKGVIALPKVGDTIWELCSKSECDITGGHIIGYYIRPIKVDLLYGNKLGWFISCSSNEMIGQIPCGELGKTLFRSRKEAERALAERSEE